MKLRLPFIFIIVVLISTYSCKITKRLYTKGYHIESVARKNTVVTPKQNSKLDQKNSKLDEQNSTQINDIQSITFLDYEAQISDYDLSATVESKLDHKDLVYSHTSNECDLIILYDESEIKAKVIEISESHVKYKKCNYLDGPTYLKPLDDVYLIKFSNGENFIPKKNQEEEEEDEIINNRKSNNSSKFDGGASIAGLIFSIIATVFSIIAWFFSWIFTIPGLVMGLLAIIFGAIGSKKSNLRGMGVYSLVMGIITFILALVALIIILLLF